MNGQMRSRALIPVCSTVLSVAFVAAFLAVALARLGHPYELEWMGGAFADHVDRVLRGDPIYVEPSVDFVPFLYTPLFFYLGAASSLVVGEGLPALRLVSILATLGTMVLIFVVARRRTGRAHPAVVSCGMFAACYGLLDSWYDTARADSLFLFLLLAALATLLIGTRWRSALGAAALLTLAYMSKQTALLLSAPFAIAVALRDVRRALVFAGGFGVLWTGTVLAMDAAHDGWFTFYTWTMPRRHEYLLQPLWDFWLSDLAWLYPALAVSAWFLVHLGRTGRTREMLEHGAWGGGLLLAACSSRMHVGGAENVLMPAYLALSMLTGLALAEAQRTPADQRGRLAHLVPIAVLIQLAILVYDPLQYVPTREDRRAGDAVVAAIAETRGPVIVPLHGYLPKLAGKPGTAHTMAVLDVLRGAETRCPECNANYRDLARLDAVLARDGRCSVCGTSLGEVDRELAELAARLDREYWGLVRDREVELVVLDDNFTVYVNGFDLVGQGFRVEDLFRDSDSLFPVVGLQARPRLLYRRIR